METIDDTAIKAVLSGQDAFCKFMSANDSGENGGHQNGILISTKARHLMFTEEEIQNNSILKKWVNVVWQKSSVKTRSSFIWYKSKREIRITNFGRHFPFRGPENTGALFVLVKLSDQDYEAYILNHDDEIQRFLEAFGMTPADTNDLIEVNKADLKTQEKAEIEKFIATLNGRFPDSNEMAAEARFIDYAVYSKNRSRMANPDSFLIEWTQVEYRLFRAIENHQYSGIVSKGFRSVDEFVIFANQVLNRRKSRAGKSLEHHLAEIFERSHLRYTAQAVTEEKKRPDFVFPSIEDYRNPAFPVDRICTLAAKTTCKDRWRQILNESNRLRDRNKYLCTLQQAISAAQMDEMQKEKVILVVPKPYISTYPRDRQDRIWTIAKFIAYVQEMEKD